MVYEMDRFRDPIHGFIEVRPLEKKIIDSLPFQRLRNIKQLAFTNYVYHGAEHTRFGHSIGVMHLATKAFRSAVSKGTYRFEKEELANARTIEWLEQILRLIALTHDLGHAPFSHAGEDAFPVKQTLTGGKKKNYTHEDMTAKIIAETEIGEYINEIGAEFKHKYGEKYDITPELINEIYAGTIPGDKSIFTFLHMFMDSELDCDKMDYLLRDSTFCGVSYGRYDVERLISCLTIFKKKRDPAPYLGIESGGVQAFEEFVLARYFMFVQVYFHRVRRFFDITFASALKKCLPDGVFPIEVRQYLEWDDNKVMELLKRSMDDVPEAKSIISRCPWAMVYQTKTHPGGDGITLFETVSRELEKAFGKGNFIVDNSAYKAPHKIVPQKHALDDEETIAIVDKESKHISTIADESYIINTLTDKINIKRIYVIREKHNEAHKRVVELVGTIDEEEENDG